jgi:shikimate kinase
MTTPFDVSFPTGASLHKSGAGRAPVKAVFLVGFMGAGKTSVGQTLAAALGWRFVDLDTRIAAKTGRSVAEIFEQEGEPSFRKMEHDELRSLLGELDTANTVVSLGGGAWMQPANTAVLRQASVPVLFLDAPVEELWQRCLPEQKTRPLLESEEGFRELYAARRKAYAKDTLLVETEGRSIEEVASQIRLLLGLAGTDATP